MANRNDKDYVSNVGSKYKYNNIWSLTSERHMADVFRTDVDKILKGVDFSTIDRLAPKQLEGDNYKLIKKVNTTNDPFAFVQRLKEALDAANYSSAADLLEAQKAFEKIKQDIAAKKSLDGTQWTEQQWAASRYADKDNASLEPAGGYDPKLKGDNVRHNVPGIILDTKVNVTLLSSGGVEVRADDNKWMTMASRHEALVEVAFAKFGPDQVVRVSNFDREKFETGRDSLIKSSYYEQQRDIMMRASARGIKIDSMQLDLLKPEDKKLAKETYETRKNERAAGEEYKNTLNEGPDGAVKKLPKGSEPKPKDEPDQNLSISSSGMGKSR